MCTLVVVSAVFVFFVVEVIFTILADRSYFFTFFCWLDIVGALSLIPDMLQLIEGMGLLQSAGDNDINNVGKVGRVARSASTVKLARFARIFRVVRLVRVIRLFRMSLADRQAETEKTPSRPSNVGKLLAQKVTQRIVALIIAMILVLPYLEVAPLEGNVNMKTILTSIEKIRPIGSLEFNTSISVLVQEMEETGQPFVYLQVAGMKYVELDDDTMDKFRTSDIISHCVPDCDGIKILSEYRSSAQIDVKQINIVQAQLSMTMCLFVVTAFVASSHSVSSDARELVIKPIERMTKIVHKLASTVCILSNENAAVAAASEDGGRGGGEDGGGSGRSGGSDGLSESSGENLNEAELLEEVMMQMTVALKAKERRQKRRSSMMSRASSFLTSGGGGGGGGGSRRRRSSEMSSGSGNRWKSRFSFSGSAHIYAAAGPDGAGSGGSSNGRGSGSRLASDLTTNSFSQLTPDVRCEIQQHPALLSIESILHNQLASKYLRQYMARTLTLENYMFWDEVEKLKAMQMAQRQLIFRRFILESSPHQVNLDASSRGRIEMLMIESRGITTPFDDAAKIVVSLMQLNTYINFLTSDKCRQYMQESALQQKIKRAAAGSSSYVHVIEGCPRVGEETTNNDDGGGEGEGRSTAVTIGNGSGRMGA